MSRFRPVPGTQRCALCREVLNASHVSHSRLQLAQWWFAYYTATPLRLVFLILTGANLMMTLAVAIASARTLLGG